MFKSVMFKIMIGIFFISFVVGCILWEIKVLKWWWDVWLVSPWKAIVILVGYIALDICMCIIIVIFLLKNNNDTRDK